MPPLISRAMHSSYLAAIGVISFLSAPRTATPLRCGATRDPDGLREPDGSAIRGRFSPHPNVWTMFMGVYILLTIAALRGLS